MGEIATGTPSGVSNTDLSHSKFFFRRYRVILIAVACFLVFDLGVLILNFYTSFQIGEDAIGINLSGRQRMLSQRTAKALLSVEAARENATFSGDAALEELKGAVSLFDATLRAFQVGDIVPGGDGNPVFLRAAPSDQSQVILQNAQDIWKPYHQLLLPVLSGKASADELHEAVVFALANNTRLLGLMNDLTTDLELLAEQRASRLRMVQTIGILLALMNFVFILYKFIGQLRTADIAIEIANEENREILGSVREGLFLITSDYRIGMQISGSSNELFGHQLQYGDDFFDLLQPRVSGKVLKDAHEYVKLLFSSHIKEGLVQSINPLSEVEVQIRNRLGHEELRYLSFSFNRVKEADGQVRHLLVTVQDVTQRVELEKRLHDERHRSQREFSMLLKAIEADPVMLRDFVQRADESLFGINDLLRSTAGMKNERDIVMVINDAARRVHAFKGDAAALGLETLSELAHDFETELQHIRESGADAGNLGDALLALPIPLGNLLSKVTALKGLISGMRQSDHTIQVIEDEPVMPVPVAAGNALGGTLIQLARSVADDQGKQVRANVNVHDPDQLDAETGNLLREIVVQLTRNAVVHGIETPDQRGAAGKAPEGKVDILLDHYSDKWTLRVRDNGAGLSIPGIRRKLAALGWYSEADLERLSDREIINSIFKPGFSMAKEVSMHAGRGAGLDVVAANVKRLKSAHLHIHSVPGEFTEFIVRFTA